MAEWIDDCDCYRCPDCGFETHNPNDYGCKCPVCGFVADSDKVEPKPKRKCKQPVTRVFTITPEALTAPVDVSALRIAQLQMELGNAQRLLRVYRMAFRLMRREMGR